MPSLEKESPSTLNKTKPTHTDPLRNPKGDPAPEICLSSGTSENNLKKEEEEEIKKEKKGEREGGRREGRARQKSTVF